MATFTATGARSGTDQLNRWVEFVLEPVGGGSLTTYRWSTLDIPDSNRGQIQGRLLSMGRLIRALSDRYGRYEASGFTWTLSDYDRTLLSLLEHANYRYMANRVARVCAITDAERRSGGTETVLGRLFVNKINIDKRRKIVFSASDLLSSTFTNTASDEQLPRRRISASFFADAPDSVLGLPEPIIYGQVDEPGPSFNGLVPCIPIGTEVISAFTWNRFLVAGHAVKEIRAMFSGGVLWSGGQAGVDYLVPGYTGWPFGTNYRDFNDGVTTRRYTVIYARGPIGDNAVNGTAPLSCNVYGIETAGDSSGTVITDIIDQYYHWYINFCIQDWQAGAWLANPDFIAGIDVTPRVNQASFTAAKAALVARLGGGYLGGGMIGNNGDLRAKADWITAWNISGAVRSGFNKSGQFSVFVPDAGTSAVTLSQMNDIIEDTFTHEPVWEDMYNVLPYSYARDWKENVWGTQTAKVKNQNSIDAFKIRREDAVREFWFIMSSAIAENNAAHCLRHVMNQPILGGFDTKLYAIQSADLGSTITVDHLDGLGSAVWTARQVLIDRIDVAPQTGNVSFSFEDLTGRPALSYTTEVGTPGTGGTPVSYPPGTSLPPVAPEVVAVGYRPLGGSRNQSPDASTSMQNAIDYIDVKVDWSQIPNLDVRADIEMRTSNGANSVGAEITEVSSAGAIVGLSVSLGTSASTSFVKAAATLPRQTGIRYYRLRHNSTGSAVETYAIGGFEYVPV